MVLVKVRGMRGRGQNEPYGMLPMKTTRPPFSRFCAIVRGVRECAAVFSSNWSGAGAKQAMRRLECDDRADTAIWLEPLIRWEGWTAILEAVLATEPKWAS